MKAHIVTLGCPKNLVDSEAAASMLRGSGCTTTDDPVEADLLLVGACSFLNASWQETVEEVERLATYKTNGKRLVLMGCLPLHREEDIKATLPDVDHFLPTGGHAALPGLVQAMRDGAGAARVLPESNDRFAGLDGRELLTPAHTAYVKVAEGCNRKCTFCAIPAIRGRQTTRPIAAIVAEVRGHVERGVREVTLVAQDIVSYSDGGHKIHALVEQIAATGIEWVRLLYLHPAGIDSGFVTRLLDNPALCRYLEMPVQHASTRMLERMKRAHTREHITGLIRGIRDRHPDIVLRSEVIVGFPGESEGEFEELKEFVQEFEFDSLGIFPYSREPGTVAARMEGHLPEHVIRERVEELTLVQEAVSFGARARFLDRTLKILVDRETMADDAGFEDCDWAGRFYGQSLEVDGEVYLHSEKPLTTGQFVNARIIDTSTFDLRGTVS